MEAGEDDNTARQYPQPSADRVDISRAVTIVTRSNTLQVYD